MRCGVAEWGVGRCWWRTHRFLTYKSLKSGRIQSEVWRVWFWVWFWLFDWGSLLPCWSPGAFFVEPCLVGSLPGWGLLPLCGWLFVFLCDFFLTYIVLQFLLHISESFFSYLWLISVESCLLPGWAVRWKADRNCLLIIMLCSLRGITLHSWWMWSIALSLYWVYSELWSLSY